MAEQKETKAAEVKDVKMVAPENKIEMVKVKVLRPFFDATAKRVHSEGVIVEVTAEDAKRLTKDSWGAYAFRGERFTVDGDVKRHNLKYAELVAA